MPTKLRSHTRKDTVNLNPIKRLKQVEEELEIEVCQQTIRNSSLFIRSNSQRNITVIWSNYVLIIIWDMPAIHFLCSVFKKGLLWFGLRKLLSCLWSIELIVELENMKICSLYFWRNHKLFSQIWFTNFCLIVGIQGLCILFDTNLKT